MEPGPSQSQGNIWPALVGQVHRLWGCIFLAAVICPLAGEVGLKAREGSLVNKTGVRPVPGQGPACWWVGCNCRLQTCGFPVAGVCPLVGKARPKARAGSISVMLGDKIPNAIKNVYICFYIYSSHKIRLN